MPQFGNEFWNEDTDTEQTNPSEKLEQELAKTKAELDKAKLELNKSLKLQIETQKKLNKALTDHKNDKNDLLKKLHDRDDQIDEQDSEISRLKKSISALEHEKSVSAATHAKTLSVLQAQIAKLTLAEKAHAKETESYEQALEDAQDEISQLERELSTAQQSLKDAQENIDALRRLSEVADNRSDALENRTEEALKQITALEHELQEKQAKIEALEEAAAERAKISLEDKPTPVLRLSDEDFFRIDTPAPVAASKVAASTKPATPVSDTTSPYSLFNQRRGMADKAEAHKAKVEPASNKLETQADVIKARLAAR